jgi:hypothetical protein
MPASRITLRWMPCWFALVSHTRAGTILVYAGIELAEAVQPTLDHFDDMTLHA